MLQFCPKAFINHLQPHTEQGPNKATVIKDLQHQHQMFMSGLFWCPYHWRQWQSLASAKPYHQQTTQPAHCSLHLNASRLHFDQIQIQHFCTQKKYIYFPLTLQRWWTLFINGSNTKKPHKNHYQAKVTIVKAKHAQTTPHVPELFSSTFGHPIVKPMFL